MSQCLEKAMITPQTDATGQALSDAQKKSRRLVVDFNPDTLKYNLNSATQTGRANRPAQSVTESTSKLTMDLVFDTSITGADVRYKTHKLVVMMDPMQNNGGSGGGGADTGSMGSPSDVPSQSDVPPQQDTPPQTPTPDAPRQVPAIVVFEWGTIRFEGYISSYMETMELFSREGIPLRCSVTLSITQQERTFAPPDQAHTAGGINQQLNLASSAQSLRLGAGIGLSFGMSAGVGASASVRGIAQLNGIENLRMPEVDSVLVVNARGRGPAAFSAGAGAGFGVSAGAGIGVGGGISAGAGAGIGVSAGASFSGSATASAFAGLNTQVSASARPRAGISVGLTATANSQVGLGSNSNFCPGGAATNQGSGSMSADVGINANISAGINFEGG